MFIVTKIKRSKTLLNKLKVIADECIRDRRNNTFEIVCSREITHKGAKDYEILKIAKKMNLPIWTRDIRFALEILSDNHPVIFRQNKKNYLIKPKTKIIPSFSDKITADILSTDNVIIP